MAKQALRDMPQTRDLLYSACRSKGSETTENDLRAKCSPVEDQGQLGSCTANSLVVALEFLEKKDCVSRPACVKCATDFKRET